MEFCKSGQILNYCHPNALMTLAEYLMDYASDEVAEKGWPLIKAETDRVPPGRQRALTKLYLEHIREGERDCRF